MARGDGEVPRSPRFHRWQTLGCRYYNILQSFIIFKREVRPICSPPVFFSLSHLYQKECCDGSLAMEGCGVRSPSPADLEPGSPLY